MLGLTGFLGLTRIPLGFWAHTDLTDPTVSLCGWEISQMLLWVGNLTDGSVGVGSWGLHGARSHGLIFWTLRTNQTYRTNRTDWTFLKIIREICGICVRPPWDWDLCEASVDSVCAGDKITKNCVIWGAF